MSILIFTHANHSLVYLLVLSVQTNTRPEHVRSWVRKTQPKILNPIARQGPDIKDNCSFHINCAIFYKRTLHDARVLKIVAQSIDWLQLGILP